MYPDPPNTVTRFDAIGLCSQINYTLNAPDFRAASRELDFWRDRWHLLGYLIRASELGSSHRPHLAEGSYLS